MRKDIGNIRMVYGISEPPEDQRRAFEKVLHKAREQNGGSRSVAGQLEDLIQRVEDICDILISMDERLKRLES